MSFAVLVAAFFVACAPPSTTRSRSESNVITREELVTAHASNVYDAVLRLRPSFLRYRNTSTRPGPDAGYPRVYLNRDLLGGITTLKTLSTNGVREVWYWKAEDVQTGSSIEVLTDGGE